MIFYLTAGAGITAHTEWVHGFVEELVVEDDPEYQWLDKIRTPRATNEARQTIFLKLSNEVQRRIGLKVLELGANAVIGLVILFCIMLKVAMNTYFKIKCIRLIKYNIGVGYLNIQVI